MDTINLTTRKENKMQLNGNVLTGDTYPVKDWIKTYADGKWDAGRKAWIVNREKLLKLADQSAGVRYDNQPAAIKIDSKPSNDGWCPTCHDWTYGDCIANGVHH